MSFDATPTTSPVIEHLRRGRALVARPNGWCQEASYAGERVCAAAGVQYGHPLFGVAMRYLKIALLGREAPEMIQNYKMIAAWNDAPGRQQHEVVDLYDRAIGAAIEDAHSAVA